MHMSLHMSICMAAATSSFPNSSSTISFRDTVSWMNVLRITKAYYIIWKDSHGQFCISVTVTMLLRSWQECFPNTSLSSIKQESQSELQSTISCRELIVTTSCVIRAWGLLDCRAQAAHLWSTRCNTRQPIKPHTRLLYSSMLPPRAPSCLRSRLVNNPRYLPLQHSPCRMPRSGIGMLHDRSPRNML